MRGTWSACALVLVGCGGGGGGGGGGGTSDAAPRVDAGPSPTCPENVLPVAWSKDVSLPPPPIAFDLDGSLVAADEADGCAALVRYGADGTVIARHGYDPSPPPKANYRACPDDWEAIALDHDGNIVAASDSVGVSDVVVRKHDRDGNALWTYYNQNAPDELEGADSLADLAAATDGAVVAAGAVACRPWVARLAANGDPDFVWAGAGEAATSVDVASSGDTFAGMLTGSAAMPYRIARFDADGTETEISELTRPVKPAMTPDGGLVFVISSATPRLKKIDADGNTVWEHSLSVSARDGACRYVDVSVGSLATEVGPDGSIYVIMGGEVDISEPDFPTYIDDVVVVRFSEDGEILSRHVHELEPYNFYHLAIGPDGAIAFTTRDKLVVTTPLPLESP